MKSAIAPPQFNMLSLAHGIQPMPVALRHAKIHKVGVRVRLAKAFDVVRIVEIGSHARASAIKTYSDLDLLVVLRRNEAKWGGSLMSSSTVLSKVIEELQERFPNTRIGRDGMAAAIWFGSTQQSLDVVPAIFSRFDRLRPVYLIPNGSGDWMETSPAVHDRYFKIADERGGGKVRKLSQLLKWWKFSRVQPIPISSFHIDMLLASSDICVGVKPYAHCLYQAFKLLSDRGCRGLQDPCGIAGTIHAVETETQLSILSDAIGYALAHSSAAVAAEAVKNNAEANRQWDIVFNGQY